MRQVLDTLLSASILSSQNSSVQVAGQLVSASFQPLTTDTNAAGTVKIQCSNDPNNTTPVNWANIANATSTITAGVGSMIVLGNCAYNYLRAVWTPTGATLTISITFSSVPDSGSFRLTMDGGSATMNWDNDAAGFQVLIRLISGCSNAVATGDFTNGFTITIPDATSALVPPIISNVTLQDGGDDVTVTMSYSTADMVIKLNGLSC